MWIMSGVLGTLKRWEPQIWHWSTLLHAASCCFRKSPSPPDFSFEEWEIWAHHWTHTWTHTLSGLKMSTAQVVSLPQELVYTFLICLLYHVSRRHELITTVRQLHALTTYCTQSWSLFDSALRWQSSFQQVPASPMCAVRQKNIYKLYLHVKKTPAQTAETKTQANKRNMFAVRTYFSLPISPSHALQL